MLALSESTHALVIGSEAKAPHSVRDGPPEANSLPGRVWPAIFLKVAPAGASAAGKEPLSRADSSVLPAGLRRLPQATDLIASGAPCDLANQGQVFFFPFSIRKLSVGRIRQHLERVRPPALPCKPTPNPSRAPGPSLELSLNRTTHHT